MIALLLTLYSMHVQKTCGYSTATSMSISSKKACLAKLVSDYLSGV